MCAYAVAFVQFSQVGRNLLLLETSGTVQSLYDSLRLLASPFAPVTISCDATKFSSFGDKQ